MIKTWRAVTQHTSNPVFIPSQHVAYHHSVSVSFVSGVGEDGAVVRAAAARVQATRWSGSGCVFRHHSWQRLRVAVAMTLPPFSIGQPRRRSPVDGTVGKRSRVLQESATNPVNQSRCLRHAPLENQLASRPVSTHEQAELVIRSPDSRIAGRRRRVSALHVTSRIGDATSAAAQGRAVSRFGSLTRAFRAGDSPESVLG